MDNASDMEIRHLRPGLTPHALERLVALERSTDDASATLFETIEQHYAAPDGLTSEEVMRRTAVPMGWSGVSPHAAWRTVIDLVRGNDEGVIDRVLAHREGLLNWALYAAASEWAAVLPVTGLLTVSALARGEPEVAVRGVAMVMRALDESHGTGPSPDLTPEQRYLHLLFLLVPLNHARKVFTKNCHGGPENNSDAFDG